MLRDSSSVHRAWPLIIALCANKLADNRCLRGLWAKNAQPPARVYAEASGHRQIVMRRHKP
jgi:hypothetical protein